MKTTKITSQFQRMFFGAWRQKSRTHRCPSSPSLKGKIVAITGGNRGIRLETVKGLIARDAEVIILARNKERTENVIDSLHGIAHYVALDLGDIGTIAKSVTTLKEVLNGRKIDIFINNAGIAVQGGHTLSPQGYELSFAVNVLGHHVLFKDCHAQGLLSRHAHIISVTGDIYIQAKDCTPDYTYKGKSGIQAYSRSKVGLMWWAYQLHKNYPQYKMNLVHPGIVPSGLGNDENTLLVRTIGRLFISAKLGAQMTLICVTQPNIENGAYYNNVFGKVILPENDIALDTKRAEQFWQTLKDIYTKQIKP